MGKMLIDSHNNDSKHCMILCIKLQDIKVILISFIIKLIFMFYSLKMSDLWVMHVSLFCIEHPLNRLKNKSWLSFLISFSKGKLSLWNQDCKLADRYVPFYSSPFFPPYPFSFPSFTMMELVQLVLGHWNYNKQGIILWF